MIMNVPSQEEIKKLNENLTKLTDWKDVEIEATSYISEITEKYAKYNDSMLTIDAKFITATQLPASTIVVIGKVNLPILTHLNNNVFVSVDGYTTPFYSWIRQNGEICVTSSQIINANRALKVSTVIINV